MMAYCGIDCTACEARLATQNNDDALRAKVAAEWSAAYNVTISAASISCTGCKSDGVKFSYCENLCEVRKCASSRRIDTCAECSDFACPSLEAVFQHAPQLRQTLEALKTP